MAMDKDNDNFEFKPLTKGLGFDKSTAQTPSTARKQAPKNAPIPSVKAAVSNAVNSALTEQFSHEPLTDTFAVKKSGMPSTFIEKTARDTVRSTARDMTRDIAKETPKKSTPPLFEKTVDWNISPPKTSRSITEMINALPPSIDFFDEDKAVKPKEAKVYRPLGRGDYAPNPIIPALDPMEQTEVTAPEQELKVDVSLDNTLEKAFPKVGFRRPFFHQAVEVQPQFTEVNVSFTSAVLDALVITGLTALMLVGLILLTGVDLIAVVLHSRASYDVWLELGSIFLGVYLLYYMIGRGFWGSTLGDWAFDIHLGSEEDRQNWYYPYQVIYRMAVIAATGFVLFPIASMIKKEDMAARFSKLRLFIKNY